MNRNILWISCITFIFCSLNMETKTPFAMEQILAAAKALLSRKDSLHALNDTVSSAAKSLDEATNEWKQKGLTSLREIISKERAGLQVGDKVFYPVNKDPNHLIWQIREVENISEPNTGTHFMIKWKLFQTFGEDQIIERFLKRIPDDECITKKMIPFSVVNGDVEAFKLLLKVSYGSENSFIILH